MQNHFSFYRQFDEASGNSPEKSPADTSDIPATANEPGNTTAENESREDTRAPAANLARLPIDDALLRQGSGTEEKNVPEQESGSEPEEPPGASLSVPSAARRGKYYHLKIVSILLAVCVLLGAIIGSATQLWRVHMQNAQVQSGHPTAAFESAPCPFPLGAGLVEGQHVSCGYVTVPENRDAHNGKTIKLAVAIFKSTHYMQGADPDPVVQLDGGPGGSSLPYGASSITSDNYDTFVFNHDLILFDQRGTGYSQPSLQCMSSENTQTCHDRLLRQGIDLNGFNTLQNADDVADLIHALGYQQMTLYGVSYGTRLALTVMRLHPEMVHAAVLDSVYPTNHNVSDDPASSQRAFTTLFQGCAKNSRCNTKYPDLQMVFYQLVDTLNIHPIRTDMTIDKTLQLRQTVTISGDDLLFWLFQSLYATSLIPTLPHAIYQIKAHDYTPLSFYYELATGLSDDTSAGLNYSTECSEDWPFLSQQDITRSLKGIQPQLTALYSALDQQMLSVCQMWHVQKVPALQKQAVVSTLPTLITTGEYDPITPPANGLDAAKTLSHSYFFEFPGQGHGQEGSSFCSNQIISSFEDNPNQRPDASCISQMSEPAFQ